MTSRLDGLIRQREGILTQELVLQPGRFGLGHVPRRLFPDHTTDSVCGFCSTGCALTVHLRDGAAIGLSPATEYPVNLGMACPKGWEALEPLKASDRATVPLLRNASGELEPTDWDEAMQVFTLRMRAIQDQHGPAAAAFISTGQIVTEEMALLGAVAKFGMGMLHGDGNTRQCMATSVAAYKQSFGFDSPPFTYGDFEESDVIVLVGSNLCIAHPILWQRVLRNRRQAQIIVIDPRATETASAASRHYALQPKSDLALLYGLAHLLIRRGAIDRAFIESSTTNFEEFADFVATYTPEYVGSVTGLGAAAIHELAHTIASHRRVSFWWTMGVNQSHEGTRTAQAIINLALMTGNLGRPGTGANSITGQCNAMGSRLFSNTTNLLGGHDFANPSHREKIASALGIPETTIPRQVSLAYDQILEEVRAGKIKALWVIGTNPFHSWMSQGDLARLRRQLDFLVVQDMYASTETAQVADLVLPAAGWGEKEGTFINSERRIGLAKKVARAPGQALADFHIFRLVAHYWGCAGLFAEWTSPEAVFQILKRVSAGQPCDITGIEDYRMIDREGGVQWPFPSSQSGSPPAKERRLFEDGEFFHADRKARFCFESPRPPAEVTDADYPFILLTGRGTSAQWHTQTRTAKSAILRKLYPASIYVEVHPHDADRLGIASGASVTVRSRRGELAASALISATVPAGQVFLPMHYPEVNRLTISSVDPYSRQPAYKFCAVALEKAGEEGRS